MTKRLSSSDRYEFDVSEHGTLMIRVNGLPHELLRNLKNIPTGLRRLQAYLRQNEKTDAWRQTPVFLAPGLWFTQLTDSIWIHFDENAASRLTPFIPEKFNAILDDYTRMCILRDYIPSTAPDFEPSHG